MAEPIDLAQINLSMTIEGFDYPRRQKWLEQSWAEPSDFWQSLVERHSMTFHLRSKSVPFQYYDFVYDILHRVENSSLPALHFIDSQGEEIFTYESLRKEVAGTAQIWLAGGVQPGATIAILLPFGAAYIIALLAGLAIGATVSFIPPSGTLLVNKRLENLGPDFVVSDELYGRLAVEAGLTILPPRVGQTNAPLPTYAYPSGAPAFRLFDAAQQRENIPVELTADVAYLSALRDGMIFLGLRPGDTFAAPGAHLLEHQPCLVLATLINGATWLEAKGRDGRWWSAQNLRAILLSTSLRDELLDLERPNEIKWDLWIRSLTDGSSLDRWQALAAFGNIQDIAGASGKWNAALGGAILWSLRRRGSTSGFTLPAPGVPWRLTNTSDGLSEAIMGFGLFTPLWLEETPVEGASSACLMAEGSTEYPFSGILGQSRRGRFYPVAELLGILRNEFGTDSCAVGVVPRPGSLDSRFDALVFTGEEQVTNETALVEKMERLTEQQLGSDFKPDKVVILPLCVRRGEGEDIDLNWISSHYTSGALSYMARTSKHRALSDLRSLLRREDETLELATGDSVK